MTTLQPTIIYMLTDAAPRLTTCAFLPVIRSFTAPAGIRIDQSDISVAARVLAEFDEYRGEQQRALRQVHRQCRQRGAWSPHGDCRSM